MFNSLLMVYGVLTTDGWRHGPGPSRASRRRCRPHALTVGSARRGAAAAVIAVLACQVLQQNTPLC